jgi:hypothetical protein
MLGDMFIAFICVFALLCLYVCVFATQALKYCHVTINNLSNGIRLTERVYDRRMGMGLKLKEKKIVRLAICYS